MRQIKSKQDLKNEDGFFNESTVQAFNKIHGAHAFENLPDEPEAGQPTRPRSEMSNSEKDKFIAEYGKAEYLKLPQ